MAKAATGNRGRRPRRVEPTYHPFFKKQGKRKVQYGYRVCWYVGEERKRAWVGSEKEAQDLVEAKRAEGGLRAVGVNLVPTKLSPSQIESAERAFDLLHEANFLDVRDATTSPQLIAAVEWFLRRYEDPSKAPSVSEYVEVFARSRAQRDKRTRQDYASCLKLFVEAGYGSLRLDEVTSEHIRAFIDSRDVGSTTKKKYYTALRALFYLACRKSEYGPQWLTNNPVLEVTRPNASTPRRVIYSVDEAKDLIQVSLLIGCAPVVILRLFTMLRADEAGRFLSSSVVVRRNGKDAKVRRDPWGDIDLANGIVRYHEPTNDQYSRNITIYPVLNEWLQLFRERKIPLVATRLEEQARKIAVPLKYGDGFDNLIRHTAISYRATKCDSKIETSEETGTSESIIRRHYMRRVTKADADRLYGLGPSQYDLNLLQPGRSGSEDLARYLDRYPKLADFLSNRGHRQRSKTHRSRKRIKK